MTGDWADLRGGVSLVYLTATILFLAALLSLTSSKFRRTGRYSGMASMALAVGTTLATHNAAALPEILIALAMGGAIGLVGARRVALAAIPHLVAVFQGLLGLAAMAVSAAVYLDPETFGTIDPVLREIGGYGRLELALGLALGGMVFTGSLAAFLKLCRPTSTEGVQCPGRHLINLALMAVLAGAAAWLCMVPASDDPSWLFLAVAGFGCLFGILLVIPFGRADIPVALSMLTSCSGCAGVAIGLTLQNAVMIWAGLLVGSSGAMLGHRLCRRSSRRFLSAVMP